MDFFSLKEEMKTLIKGQSNDKSTYVQKLNFKQSGTRINEIKACFNDNNNTQNNTRKLNKNTIHTEGIFIVYF